MGSSADFRVAAALVVALALVAPLQAEGYDHENGTRRSTWELSTSLAFHRYFEPFPRVASARACRDLCVENRSCKGWTYYDPHFQEAGAQSYKLQRVCVLGAGLKDKKSGNRPGRTSGVVHPLGEYE
jgi:hypothetical protein